jgi:hypothetical protein
MKRLRIGNGNPCEDFGPGAVFCSLGNSNGSPLSVRIPESKSSDNEAAELSLTISIELKKWSLEKLFCRLMLLEHVVAVVREALVRFEDALLMSVSFDF